MRSGVEHSHDFPTWNLVQFTVRIDNRLTRHNPACDQTRRLEHDDNVFPVFRKRVKVVFAASADQEDVVSVSEIDFDMSLTRFTSCFRISCLSMTAKKTESLISPLATNPMPEPCSSWKISADSLSVLATNGFRRENRMTFSIKFLSSGSKIDAAILARHQCSPTTRKSLTSAVMSLSSWSSSNSSVLAWNSSSEFKMWLSLDKTFLCSQATYLPRGTNGFFVAEWIALGLTCPGDLCVFKFVCNCAITPSIPNLELSRRSSFLSSWIPSWTLTGFAHSTRTSCSANWCRAEWFRCIPFPPKCLHEGQIHRTISSMQSQSLCHSGIAVSPRPFICLSANRVNSGSFW